MRKKFIYLFFIIPITSFCQPSTELSLAVKKYPNQIGIFLERKVDVEIKQIDSADPLIYLNNKEVLFILTDNFSSYSNGVEYYGYGYNLKKLEAYTLAPQLKDYKKIKVKLITKTTEIGDGLFYDDQIAMKYIFPGVCKGSKLVQEVNYTVDKVQMPIVFYFGSSISIEKAEVKLSFPENVNIRYKLFGTDSSKVKFSKEKKGNKWLYTWVADDVPRYSLEDDAPSSRYIIPHLGITITGYTCDKVHKPVIKDVNDLYRWDYDRIKNLDYLTDKDIKTLSDSITNGVSEEFEKVKKIFRWVQKNIRYVAIEDGENGYVPRQPSLVLHRRYGDCKDKSSLLKALMISQGIDASLAWVGTRSLPYKYSEFPSVLVDNHMISVYCDKEGKPYLLDGTTHNHPIDVIPYAIQGKECLIERGPEKYKLYNIPVSLPESNALIDSVSLRQSSDTLYGYGRAYLTGEYKVEMIDHFDGAEPKRFKDIVIKFLPKGSNKLIVDNVKLSDINRIDDTLKIKYDLRLSNYISVRNDAYYLNLNLDKTLQDINIKPDRTQPIEEPYPSVRKVVYEYQIPNGYEIQKVPEESSFKNDKFSFHVNYKLQKDKVVLTKEIRINFLLLTENNFAVFKEMIATLNKSYIQTLVFRKKQK